MVIKVGSVQLNCHFFALKEIELDIDPHEIHGPDDHNAVLCFLEHLSTTTRKRLLVTAENCQDIVLLAFEPATQSWAIHEPLNPGDA